MDAELVALRKALAARTAPPPPTPLDELLEDVSKRVLSEAEHKRMGPYPVPDAAHARSALGFAAMHHGRGSPTYAAVKAKVKRAGFKMGASRKSKS